MHYQLLITIEAPSDADSADVRDDVFDRLMNDDSFCGEGGRFGSPLCDWFVIGGRWSGMLGERALGDPYKDTLRASFPELAGGSYPCSFVDKHGGELDALWQAHGGTGPSPYTRSGYEQLGYPDDAMPLTQALYDALLAEYPGQSSDGGQYADLDDEALGSDFVGRKWLIVVDYHN